MKLKQIDPSIFDSEIDYFPLYDGKVKPSAMGLRKLKNYSDDPSEKNKTFQFGNSFNELRKSKELCRDERLGKYYQRTGNEYPQIIKHIVFTLCAENSDYFTLYILPNGSKKLECHLTNEELIFNEEWQLIDSVTALNTKFVDSFDALAMQVSEDMVIHHVPNGQLNPFKAEQDKKDFASYIHLCHCNGWDAEGAINKSFDHIHEEVPRIAQIIPNSIRMMLSFLNQDFRFERIAAISFKTSPYINRHSADELLWRLPYNPKDPYLTARVERQTVKGFSESEAFLFTIRTYLYHIGPNEVSLNKERANKRLMDSIAVFENPDKNAFSYEIIQELKANGVMDYLKRVELNK